MKFDPDQPRHKRAIVILTWIATACAVIGVLFLFFKTDIIINNTKQPSFVVIGNAPYVRLNFTFKVDLPTVLEPYKKPDEDSTNQESIVFKIEKEVNKKFVKLEPLKKLNVDSIVSSSIEKSDYVILPKLEFNLSIKNIGDRIGQVVLLVATDSLTTDNFLLPKLLGGVSDSQSIFENISDFEKLSVPPDSLIDVKFSNIIPQFFDSQKRFNIHLCIIYCDPDNNLYMLYHIVQYQEKNFEYSILPQPIYQKQTDGKWILDEVVTHYVPKKPQFLDMYQLVNVKSFMDHKLTEKEKEKLIKNFGNINFKSK